MNKKGRKVETKKNIRQFSGFPSGTKKEEKVSKIEEKKKAWTIPNLKLFLGMLGLEKGGDRSTLINRLVDYLFEPTITKAVKVSGKKRVKSVVSKEKKVKTSKKSKKEVEVEDGAEEDDFKEDDEDEVEEGDKEEGDEEEVEEEGDNEEEGDKEEVKEEGDKDEGEEEGDKEE